MLEKQNTKIIFLMCTNLGTHISVSLPIKQQQAKKISVILLIANVNQNLSFSDLKIEIRSLSDSRKLIKFNHVSQKLPTLNQLHRTCVLVGKWASWPRELIALWQKHIHFNVVCHSGINSLAQMFKLIRFLRTPVQYKKLFHLLGMIFIFPLDLSYLFAVKLGKGGLTRKKKLRIIINDSYLTVLDK